MPTIIHNGQEEHVDGFVRKLIFPDGKVYALQCDVVAVKPIVCPKCGGTVTLRYGEGKCDFCGVCYTTRFELVEASVVSEDHRDLFDES